MESTEEVTDTRSHSIYVVSHGWHTGIVVPSADITSRLPKLGARFSGIPYIELGWGDKGFYQSKEITSSLTVRAIFWPTESVIHAVAVPVDVRSYFQDSEVELLCLSTAHFTALIQFMVNSFYKMPEGEVLETRRGIYGDSQFYKGVGDYYLFNTCNKWTAKGIKSAGFDISPTFKLSASSVMSYMTEYNQTHSSLGCLDSEKAKSGK